MRLSFTAMLLLLLPSFVWAHGLGIEARIIDEQVRIEAFFDDDTPARSAKITIEDIAKTVLNDGLTDDQGFWTIPKPKPGKYIVRVDAGDGHAAKTTITIPGDQLESESHPSRIESDSASREFLTGWNRLLMTSVGLALIAGLTLAIRLTRKRS